MSASAWTDDRTGRLTTLWIEGRSAAAIARALGCGITRNAVLGKVHRLGLSAAGPRERARPATSPAPRAVVPEVAAATGGGTGGVTLAAIGRHQCRWPLGDPGAAGFSLCGRRVDRGAYCSVHGEIAYRPARVAAGTLERLARLD